MSSVSPCPLVDVGRLVRWCGASLALCLGCAVAAGCAPAAAGAEMERYDEPDDRFSLLIPSDWEEDSTSPEYQFYAVMRSRDGGETPDAWIGLTWMPPPCDRTMVDDPVAWYADLLCWQSGSQELARTETEVDGRRALLIDCTSASNGRKSRQLTLLMEKYGIVWQVTCGVTDAADYPAFDTTFRAMLRSLEIHGAWSGVAG